MAKKSDSSTRGKVPFLSSLELLLREETGFVMEYRIRTYVGTPGEKIQKFKTWGVTRRRGNELEEANISFIAEGRKVIDGKIGPWQLLGQFDRYPAKL